MVTRLTGLALLAMCALAVRQLHHLVLALAHHQPTPVEMLLSLVAVLAGIGGAATLVIGPALFRPYAWPPADRPPRG